LREDLTTHTPGKKTVLKIIKIKIFRQKEKQLRYAVRNPTWVRDAQKEGGTSRGKKKNSKGEIVKMD